MLYIHVPKCGGSSFGAALRLRYAWSQATIPLGLGDPKLTGAARILSDYEARDAALRALIDQGTRMISGHVRYNPALHETSGYRHVTLLRDPVARFVSHYNYLQRQHADPKRPATLEAFLDTPDARRLASQYLFYFAGESQVTCADLPVAIERAKHNIAQFDLVGDLEDPQGFARGLRQLTGTPIPVLRRNRAPARTLIDASLRPQIEALCEADLAIYHHARQQAEAA